MQRTRHLRSNQHGGVLVLALLMTAMAGIFLTGWVALSSTRAVQARATENAARRRLMLENSRAYARQMTMERMFSGSSTVAANQTGELDPTGTSGSGWGGLDTSAGWGTVANPLQVYDLPTQMNYPAAGMYTTLFPYNGLGLHPGASFATTQKLVRPSFYQGATGALPDPFNADGSVTTTLDPYKSYLFGKGIFPCLAGDTFVIYRKPWRESGEIVVDANIQTDGRLVVRDPASLFNSATVNLGAKVRVGLRSKRFYVQKCDANNRVTGSSNGAAMVNGSVVAAGSELMPMNLPCVPSTFGPFNRTGTDSPVAGAPSMTQLYRGELDIIKNTYVPSGLPAPVPDHNPNCLWQIQTREATSTPVRAAVQTISVGTASGTPLDPYWIEDQIAPTYPPPAWPSGYPPVWKVLFINLQHASLPNLRIYGVVHQVVLLGQTTNAEYNSAANMDPRIIIMVPDAASRAVQDIRFVRENNRPLILGVKGDVRQPLGMFWTGPNVNTGTSLTLEWRLMLINEYRQIMCNLPSGGGGAADSVAIYGGVLTNWSFERYDAGVATRFQIYSDPLTGWDNSTSPATYKLTTTAGYKLASLLPRDAWLEPYFTLQ
jgi:hypothetical protein